MTISATSSEPRARLQDANPYPLLELTGSPQVIRQTFPSLARVDDRTAGLLAIELTTHFNARVEVTAESLGTCKTATFFDRLEDPGCANHLQFEALGGHGLLCLESSLLFGLLERLFGGRADDSTAPPAATPRRARFSAIEERVIRRLVRLFGRSMEEAWRGLVPLTVRHLSIETKPGNVPIAGPAEPVAATAFNVSIDGTPLGALLFAMPLTLLEVHRERLSALGFSEPSNNDDHWRRRFAEAFQRVSVTLVVELGRADLSVSRLLALQVGDIIRLDQSPEHPVRIAVEGIPKYLGEPLVQHGNLAVRLHSLYDETAATLEGDAS